MAVRAVISLMSLTNGPHPPRRLETRSTFVESKARRNKPLPGGEKVVQTRPRQVTRPEGGKVKWHRVLVCVCSLRAACVTWGHVTTEGWLC